MQASPCVPQHSSVHLYLIPVSKLPEGNVNFTSKFFKLIPNSSSIRETGASFSTVNINSLSKERALNFCLKGWELKEVMLVNTCLHRGKQHMEGDNRWFPNYSRFTRTVVHFAKNMLALFKAVCALPKVK